MTICIGMLASDGLVIAADSQESDTYLKRSQQKILPLIHAPVGQNAGKPAYAFAFTGAGDAGYLDSIFECLMGFPSSPEGIDLKESLEKRLRLFYKRHIFPLRETPDIELLVGAYWRFQSVLFVNRGSALRHASFRTAVGIGASFALNLMESFPFTDVARTEILAAYVISLTKHVVDGCGHFTQIVSLHNPALISGVDGGPTTLVPVSQPLTMVSGDKIARWERSFGSTWNRRERDLLKEMLEEEVKHDAASTPPQTQLAGTPSPQSPESSIHES